jgi:hypothetical protein
MTEQKNMSFTINENDISKNTFEIKIIVDDNRILNKKEIITYNINKTLNNWTDEEIICLIKCFCSVICLIIFVIILEHIR